MESQTSSQKNNTQPEKTSQASTPTPAEDLTKKQTNRKNCQSTTNNVQHTIKHPNTTPTPHNQPEKPASHKRGNLTKLPQPTQPDKPRKCEPQQSRGLSPC
ncbi:hypothetical protein [Actinobaculum massiliense]|uniref:hypothetical protein n=1 Tax=Actinobaculum massiliense TaxID=202789 RepID=UPI0012DCC78C|nr:hypothetical protein [Actinobaculum massiliense]MDK8319506.1 hypothetical protein [Actinobaculum massiliense]